MVQVNRVCLKILFINRPQFLVDSNVSSSFHIEDNDMSHQYYELVEFQQVHRFHSKHSDI